MQIGDRAIIVLVFVYVAAVFTDDGFKMAVDRFPVDFLIMLDSSARIGSENFANAKRVITVSGFQANIHP